MLLALLGTALTSGTPAFADPASSAAPPEAAAVEGVTVTARSKQERLIDVPVAASVLNSEMITRYAGTDLVQIANQVPGLVVEATSGGTPGSLITIRGVGVLGPDYGSEQPVLVMVDGVPITRGQIVNAGYFDLDNVQVLKGPQALFFGKDSPAGVISLDSVTPRDTFEGYMKVSYEFRTEDPIIEGAVSIPLTHNLSIRLAARAEDMQGGYAQNGARSLASDPIPGWGGVPLTGAVTGVYPQTKQLVGRFTAVYTPTSDFTATLKAFASTQRLINPYGDVTLTHCQAAGNHPSFVDEITGQVYIDTTETCSAPPTRTYYNEALPSTACVGMVNAPRDCIPFEQDTNFLGSLKLKYTTGAFTLTSVTGAYKLIAQQFNDSNITVYAGAPDRQNVSSYQLSQEFRVSTDFKFPVNFTAGAFFEHEYMTLMNTNIIFPLGAYPVPGPYFGITNTDLEHDRDTDDDYSFFIQASWKILANLELAGGARWTIAHKEASLYEDFSALDAFTTPATNPLAPAGTLYNPKGAYHNVSPEVTLTWHPVWNVTTYAAYKTGFLAGGIGNPGVMSNYTLLTPAEQNGQLTYQPETVRGYEGGIKGTFFGGRLSGDVDAFHYTYYDLQVATFHTATTTFTIGNAASAINEGVELQGTFRVTDDLAVHGSMTYADLHFSQYPNAPCYSGQVTPSCLSNGQQNLSGAAYGTTGPWSGAIGFTYDRPVTETWSVGLASDLRMYSRSPLQNTQPYTATAAHNLLDASLRFYQPHGRWEVALIATNLTNEYYLTNIENLPLGSPGDFEGYFNPPREIRLQLTSRF